MKLKNMTVFSILFLVVKFNFAFASSTYRCEIDLDSPWRAKHDVHVVLENVEIAETTSAMDQTLIYHSEDIDDNFFQNIHFLGSVVKDPVTNRKKLFLGVYHMWHIDRSLPPSFTNIPFTSTDETGFTSTSYGHPIASAISDSNSLEVFNGSYNDHKIKFSCKENGSRPTPVLNHNNKYEDLTCNIRVRNKNSIRRIEEFNKQVSLGYSSTLRDLQPIIEGEHTTVPNFGNLNIMGNLFYDAATNKTKLLIGFYTISRWYDPAEHAGYWTVPNRSTLPNGQPFFYAKPEAEGITDTGYIEVRTDQAFSGIFDATIACKLVGSNTNFL